jgi:flavin-dependent dehydrogenase
MKLTNGSRVAVIGGGPAGTLFSYFLLDMAARSDLSVGLDIYEPRNFFANFGPAGCNMCGGLISESLVQLLAVEGINLPPAIVQRGIDSYIMHTDLGRVKIEHPGNEKRIAAIHRGAGPRGMKESQWGSLDGYLLDLACGKGANVIEQRVEAVHLALDKPTIKTKQQQSGPYDLVVVAAGVNTALLASFTCLPAYRPPSVAKTYICEFLLGKETIDLYLGSSMHVFLLDLPRLEFAAIIPKGEFVTVCLLGSRIDQGLIDSFYAAPQVRDCFPRDWQPAAAQCHCEPGINIGGPSVPFADRIVFIGDSGINRLYKDGIGGAYRTAKAAARTAVFTGLSSKALRAGFAPTCRAMTWDNRIGKIVFLVTKVIRKITIGRKAVLGMTFNEQNNPGIPARMSGVLWDTFTGSASYRDVFLRTLHPAFLMRFAYESLAGVIPQRHEGGRFRRIRMNKGELGKTYQPGETILQQGEEGSTMYVIQSGKVEVLRQTKKGELQIAVLGPGEIFGEMVLFGNNIRSATVRTVEKARVLTIDKKIFMQKIHEDPSLAFRVMQKLSLRIRHLNEELANLKNEVDDK